MRNVQEDTLGSYTLNSSKFKSELSNEKNINELRSELFADKFYFQVQFKQSEKMSSSDINVFRVNFHKDYDLNYCEIMSIYLKRILINAEKEPISRDSVFDDVTLLKEYLNIILNKGNISIDYSIFLRK